MSQKNNLITRHPVRARIPPSESISIILPEFKASMLDLIAKDTGFKSATELIKYWALYFTASELLDSNQVNNKPLPPEIQSIKDSNILMKQRTNSFIEALQDMEESIFSYRNTILPTSQTKQEITSLPVITNTSINTPIVIIKSKINSSKLSVRLPKRVIRTLSYHALQCGLKSPAQVIIRWINFHFSANIADFKVKHRIAISPQETILLNLIDGFFKPSPSFARALSDNDSRSIYLLSEKLLFPDLHDC